MTANTIKNHLLRYFRFKRGCAYVATECWEEDVVASDGKKLFFVEVKVSWADYKREYKKSKHNKDSCPWGEYLVSFPRSDNPNRRYFASTEELAHRISEDLKAQKSDYGCLSIVESGDVRVLRRAVEVHRAKVRDCSLHRIVQRITSELITIRGQVRP